MRIVHIHSEHSCRLPWGFKAFFSVKWLTTVHLMERNVPAFFSFASWFFVPWIQMVHCTWKHPLCSKWEVCSNNTCCGSVFSVFLLQKFSPGCISGTVYESLCGGITQVLYSTLSSSRTQFVMLNEWEKSFLYIFS